MSEVKDPAIKLFGRIISLPLFSKASSSEPSSSSSPREVCSVTQTEAEEASRKELTSVQEDTEDLKSVTTSSGICERESSLLKSCGNGEQSESSVSEEKTPKKPDKVLACPRCNSMDTKFCYYNNYNVNQPRHFCKNCQRYWTAGGTMRNVPVGAGRRKNKNNSNSNSSASQYRHIMVPEALQASNLNGVLGNVLSFGPDSPLCDSMASVLNIDEKTQNGFHTCGREDDRNGPTPSDQRVSQMPYSPWPYPWNSAMPPPPATAFYQQGYPVSFYTTPSPAAAYWNVPCMSHQSESVSPTLGKHSRDGSIITNSHHHEYDNPGVLVPKTLRIDDPSEAAKSSIWSTLGINNNAAGGLFKAFPSNNKNNNNKNRVVEASPVLHANPAALSRSLTFHERT